MENAGEGKDDLIDDSRFFNFVGEVEHALETKEQFAIENFVPQDNWGTSSFRFTMLSVLESGELPNHLQKVGQVATPEIDVWSEDSLLMVTEILDDQFSGVKEITKGIVSRTKVE